VFGLSPLDHGHPRLHLVVRRRAAERGDGQSALLLTGRMRKGLEARLVGQEVEARRRGGGHEHDTGESAGIVERGP